MRIEDAAIALNKQGIAYFAEGKFAEAIKAYQDALDVCPYYIDAYYNLGLALNKANRSNDALSAFEALIELSPDHMGGRFQLGCLWMRKRKYVEAIRQFTFAEQVNPTHIETQINLAACYLNLGDINEAKTRYLKVLEWTPDDTQVLFNLGVISMHQGRVNEAVKFYLQALHIDPDFHDAHNNLAVAYLVLKDVESALLHFRAALRIKPNNEAVRHTIEVLTRCKNLSVSPPEYIRSLFDSYADHYDAHLKQSLHYQVPEHLVGMVKAYKKEKLFKLENVLDLGCGTGLSGELFKPYAERLAGVDLSKKMLDVATEKKIFDELIESDILVFLEDKKERYDLIIAGDVLVYYGDLTIILSAIARALKPCGFVVFNTEISDKNKYQMNLSGRFAHHREYIEELAFKNQLQLLKYQASTMRTQDGVPVRGHFYLFQKQP